MGLKRSLDSVLSKLENGVEAIQKRLRCIRIVKIQVACFFFCRLK